MSVHEPRCEPAASQTKIVYAKHVTSKHGGNTLIIVDNLTALIPIITPISIIQKYIYVLQQSTVLLSPLSAVAITGTQSKAQHTG